MQMKLQRRWVEMLAGLPESGMGYQRVRVRLKSGRTLEHLTVLNGQILEVADEVGTIRPDDIAEVELETSVR